MDHSMKWKACALPLQQSDCFFSKEVFINNLLWFSMIQVVVIISKCYKLIFDS